MSRLGRKRRNTRRKLLRIIMDHYQQGFNAEGQTAVKLDAKIDSERIFSLMNWSLITPEEARRIAVCFAQGYIQTRAFGDVLKAFLILKSTFWRIVFSVQTKSDASYLKPKGSDGNIRVCAQSGFRPFSCLPV